MSAGGQHLKNEGSTRQVVVAGGAAGLISRFCIAPLDVIKIRLQLQTHSLDPLKHNLRGALPVIKSVFRRDGIKGFWRGNIAAELLFVTYGAAQFTAYRSIATLLTAEGLPQSTTSFVSGATAGAIATATTYPLDLLRTRFAAQGPNKVYRSFLGSFIHIARIEGARGYFHGLSTGIWQVVPYMGIFFTVYEGLRPMAQELQLPFGTGDAVAGTIASTIAKTGVFPLDLVRKRLQVQGPARNMFADGQVPLYNQGAWQALRAIVIREGFRGLYRGLGVGLIKAAPASAVTMWSYETALRVFINNRMFV